MNACASSHDTVAGWLGWLMWAAMPGRSRHGGIARKVVKTVGAVVVDVLQYIEARRWCCAGQEVFSTETRGRSSALRGQRRGHRQGQQDTKGVCKDRVAESDGHGELQSKEKRGSSLPASACGTAATSRGLNRRQHLCGQHGKAGEMGAREMRHGVVDGRGDL